MSISLADLSAALEDTRLTETGVSFAGKSLKLDTENDVKEIIAKIEKCPQLQFLNLEGNTLGVEAAKGIGKALEKHSEFKRALWKDLFTGRMKTEIPKALEYLGDGLVKAGSTLSELDLSDNAFGPIGVEGLASLLRSSSCYGLEVLRLNNNGLGITGGKLLASALTDCYNCSKAKGKALGLKIFVAGRNRLENEGAKALADVFKMLGTLEEVVMPQNGIYQPGVAALSESFTFNKNLQIVNLNDNTIGPKGVLAFSEALPHLTNLREINFGDCLLKTKGAEVLASALEDKHENLEELLLGFNEIRTSGGLALAKAVSNKPKLKTLFLDGNQFGQKGRQELEDVLTNSGKRHILGSLDEDESEDEEDEDNLDVADSPNESDEEEISRISIEEFIKDPSDDNFIALGDSRSSVIVDAAKKEGKIYLDTYIPILMKVSALSKSKNEVVIKESTECSENLYKELFMWGQVQDSISIINNVLLANLGLIKSEDKNFCPSWDVKACLKLLESIKLKNYIPESTRCSLEVFTKR